MKKYFFILCALCVCLMSSAQSKKVEKFEKNTWKWIEGTDKYHNVSIEDGFLTITNFKQNKKATPYQNLAKTYARVPLRPNDNFKLTIKYIVADYNLSGYSIYFNVDRKCMMDEEETGIFDRYEVIFSGPSWILNLGTNQQPTEQLTTNQILKVALSGAMSSVFSNGVNISSNRLPGKVKTKGEYPMEFVLEQKSQNVTIEVNGIQIYEGQCKITNPCIGFAVPFFNKKASYIKIDEIIIEQADKDED